MSYLLQSALSTVVYVKDKILGCRGSCSARAVPNNKYHHALPRHVTDMPTISHRDGSFDWLVVQKTDEPVRKIQPRTGTNLQHPGNKRLGNSGPCGTDEVDAFKDAVMEPKPYIFKNAQKEILTPCPTNLFATFNDKSDGGGQPIFYVHIYKVNHSIEGGISVAITCKMGSETYIMTVSDSDDSIILEEGTPPVAIEGTSSGIIFYKRNYTGHQDYFNFESSKKRDLYLGYRTAEKKLVLKRRFDLADETIRMTLTRNTQPSSSR